MPADPAHKYRTDIDGLRAVAVLLVVFNHFGLHCPGGYVGVDVFFVISGYLIGASVIAEVSAGRFSLVSFYERRVRRIFPALLVMLLVTTGATAWVSTPGSLLAYGRSLLAAVLSLSNMLFWSEAGYFDTQSAAKPLLHTWSLAVEEQFYVFFPLFVLLVVAGFRNQLRKQLRLALWLTAAVSLACAVLEMRSSPTAAFFFAPLRAWELLAGVLLSQYGLAAFRNRALREAAGVAGLLLIFGPGLRYTSATAFPGWTALSPCLGAVLLIGSGGQGPTAVRSLLAWKPVAFVGLISYSLYLWHWPLLVFQSTGLLFTDVGTAHSAPKLLLLLTALVLGTLSWRFVETPFRKGRWKPGRHALFTLNGAVAALLLVAGTAIVAAKGFPSRMSGTAAQVALYRKLAGYTTIQTSLPSWRRGECFLDKTNRFSDFRPDVCLAEPATTQSPVNEPGRQRYLLFGDSLAAQLYPGLVTAYPEVTVEQATSALCTPYATPRPLDPGYRENCAALAALVNGSYLPQHRGLTVLLAGDWEAGRLGSLGDEIARIQATGNDAVVFGPALKFDTSLPELLTFEVQRRHGRADAEKALSAHFLYDAALDRRMRGLAESTWHVRYVSYAKELCAQPLVVTETAAWRTSSGCPVFAAPGTPIIFDNHHLTPEGATLMAQAMKANGDLP